MNEIWNNFGWPTKKHKKRVQKIRLFSGFNLVAFRKKDDQKATKNLNFAAYPIITRQRFKRQSGDDDLENYDYENPPQNDYNTVVRIAIIGKCMTILL